MRLHRHQRGYNALGIRLGRRPFLPERQNQLRQFLRGPHLVGAGAVNLLPQAQQLLLRPQQINVHLVVPPLQFCLPQVQPGDDVLQRGGIVGQAGGGRRHRSHLL